MESTVCRQCGAATKFQPGTRLLKCPYCGGENVIAEPDRETAQVMLSELDYESYLDLTGENQEICEILTVRCSNCGAETTLQPNVTVENCPFCGTSLILTTKSKKTIKPTALLPFKIPVDEGERLFQRWIKKRWFAPSALKKNAVQKDALQGIYIPYWIYNTVANTDYRGERGEYYYETETYTEVQGGETVTKTRKVRKTRWYPVRGHVTDRFTDILVPGSNSLPGEYLGVLEPWDLEELVPYNDQYLSGFRTESYAVDLAGGFSIAQEMIDDDIRDSVCSDIGGDEQRIDSRETEYSETTFKHVLLPLWISAYRFKNKEYRFLINARTGEIKGERPWSWIKITLAVVFGIMLLIVLWNVLNNVSS